jgi:hypothetical protein
MGSWRARCTPGDLREAKSSMAESSTLGQNLESSANEKFHFAQPQISKLEWTVKDFAGGVPDTQTHGRAITDNLLRRHTALRSACRVATILTTALPNLQPRALSSKLLERLAKILVPRQVHIRLALRWRSTKSY